MTRCYNWISQNLRFREWNARKRERTEVKSIFFLLRIYHKSDLSFNALTYQINFNSISPWNSAENSQMFKSKTKRWWPEKCNHSSLDWLSSAKTGAIKSKTTHVLQKSFRNRHPSEVLTFYWSTLWFRRSEGCLNVYGSNKHISRPATHHDIWLNNVYP